MVSRSLLRRQLAECLEVLETFRAGFGSPGSLLDIDNEHGELRSGLRRTEFLPDDVSEQALDHALEPLVAHGAEVADEDFGHSSLTVDHDDHRKVRLVMLGDIGTFR